MTMVLWRRLVLGAAGIIALGIGLAILSDPSGFYAGYGVDIGADPNLRSELRAPGANLAVLGAIILAGAVWSVWARISAILGAAVFLAYGVGRVVSMALDGYPGQGLVEAAVIEFVIGLLVQLFHKPFPEAVQLTYEIHETGAAVATVTSFERAELYVEQVHSLARPQGFPLTATIEPEE